MKRRLLLAASYSAIEPLGLLHLGGLARDLGWQRRFHLVKNHDYEGLFREVSSFKPDVIGFSAYTGNHVRLFEALDRLKQDFPNTATVIGGPHATYFPIQSSKHADFVVMSEGFNGLRNILQGSASPGIIPMARSERFPHPDRETFYSQYPEHAISPIKSIITMTGCPFACTYCYNSSTPNDTEAGNLLVSKGLGKRLFPFNIRSVEDVINEGKEIAERWPAKVIYMQDDVHAFDLREWMPQFAEDWPAKVGTPYHAQMRWEMTRDESRLDMLQKAGCFGLTLAIESSDSSIRAEVLSRKMKEELMFAGMRSLSNRKLKVRTEQMIGLPYGATSNLTPMNLEADLGLVELNSRLRSETGLPSMAWVATFAPYKGTKLGAYCEQYGHYSGDNNDVPDSFFERSVLRFPKHWVGPTLAQKKQDPSLWLPPEELDLYRNQNAELRRIFNVVTLLPQGQDLARSYLKSNQPYSFERLGRETEEFLGKRTQDKQAKDLLDVINEMKRLAIKLAKNPREQQRLTELAGYMGCLPKPELAAKRILEYGRKQNNFSPNLLSTAIRHHLYEEVLYKPD